MIQNLETKSELFYAMIDGEATEEEKKVFEEMIKNCQESQLRFEWEKDFVNLVRERVNRQALPVDLISKITAQLETSITEEIA